jgi:Spy/CpxP family protein refolding chaperone
MATTESMSDWARRLKLTAKQSAQLERVATEDDRSVASVIRQALAAYLQGRENT